MLATPALKGSGLKAIVKILNFTSINHLKFGTAGCSFCSQCIYGFLVTLTTVIFFYTVLTYLSL